MSSNYANVGFEAVKQLVPVLNLGIVLHMKLINICLAIIIETVNDSNEN